MTLIEIISVIMFGASIFFFVKRIGDNLANYLDARADEIKTEKERNNRIEDLTEREAFERIAYLYPARPEELEVILDKYYSGGFVEVEFYGNLMGELDRLKRRVTEHD